MELLIPSFLAGLLTVLAPCVIAVLPVILGGTLGQKNKWRPLVIALSLGVSVFLFTILLQATTFFIDIPRWVWRWISGTIITLFGLIMVLPVIWEKISFKLGLYKTKGLIQKSNEQGGLKGAVLLGAALGPIFTTCSPTYAVLLAIVLPQSFAIGVLNLLAYMVGLILLLLIIGYGGQKITARFKWAANPSGWFKRILGVILVLVGIAVFTGFDKTIQRKVLEAGYFGPIRLEQSLLEDYRAQ